MAQWTNYWRIITPASRKQAYETHVSNMGSAYSSFSWFSKLISGSTSRLQRYRQYDSMDKGDVNRALDIIAEEMSTKNAKTGLPFDIDYQVEDNQTTQENFSTIIRASLRAWTKLHSLNRKIYFISRTMIKYGDCFFQKVSDTKPWIYIDQSRIANIELDEFGEPIFYHITPLNTTVDGRNLASSATTIEIVPAEAMVHFSMSNQMLSQNTFGASILDSIYPDYQKLQMLEQASITYRMVRAPERRVFNIDVGNMPPQRVKQYLEQIKTEMRQKRSPSISNPDQTDSTYDPESMLEDFIFPVTAAGRSSKVETLQTGSTWEIPELDFFQDKVFRGLRIPSSYMRGQDSGGVAFNDGKTGVAYMEERVFANFVQRLQSELNRVFDEQFKIYVQTIGLNLDVEAFEITLPEPQNFALYRQAALDSDLISAFNSIEGTGYLSKRFMLERYLGLTADEIQMNELQLKQERNIEETEKLDVIRQIYDPAVYENRSLDDLESDGT
jgi:hypothetical protein